MPRAVVIAIDGLGASQLGPYGNTWIETPAFNRLATQAVLREQLFVPSSNLMETYSAIWQASDAWGRTSSQFESANLLASLRARQISTKLLTDEPDLIDHRLTADFAEHIELEASSARQLAQSWEQSHLASFFAESLRFVEELDDNSLLWIHSQGLAAPWDAPRTMRESLSDEEDPVLETDLALVPSFKLEADFDPDALHAYRCAMAAQVMVVDHCLEIMMALMEESTIHDDTLLVVAGTRGFPMGEHGTVGLHTAELYRETLHVPLFVRFPNRDYAMQRVDGIGEVGDLADVLDRWFLGHADGAAGVAGREYSFSRCGGEILLRTRYWSARFGQLTESMDDDLVRANLFVKPDDQVEVNDVVDRRRDVAEAAWRFTKSCLAGQLDAELPDELCHSA